MFTQSASSTRPEDYIGGLQVFVESDGESRPPPVLVDPQDEQFLAVGAIINLALQLMECQTGRTALTSVGIKFIRHSQNFEHIYEDSLNNMGYWVDMFLYRIRRSFPAVLLSNNFAGESEAEKANWALGGAGMSQWNPKEAGAMRLKYLIISDLLTAGRNALDGRNEDDMIAFERLIFLMAIATAHEIVHLFVGFLTGYGAPTTPPEVSFLPGQYNTVSPTNSNVKHGESGRAWEGAVFGGTVEAFESSPHPLGTRQSGVFYLLQHDERAREVDQAYIRRILDFNFQFPVTTRGRSISIQRLFASFRLMHDVRQERMSPTSVQSRHRHFNPTVSLDTLREYRQHPDHTIRGREFRLLLRIPRDPRRLFSAAD
ncbi:hypothetical protein F5Y03DRAFT_390288 [Xylaria venustula]|nr:hypothetical protein F5Y03DRAFT_390288 [Xylaria venustula]